MVQEREGEMKSRGEIREGRSERGVGNNIFSQKGRAEVGCHTDCF